MASTRSGGLTPPESVDAEIALLEAHRVFLSLPPSPRLDGHPPEDWGTSPVVESPM